MDIPMIYLACANHFLKRKGKWVQLNYLNEEIDQLGAGLKKEEKVVPLLEGEGTLYAYELLTGGRFIEDIAVFHLSGKLTDREVITFDSGDQTPMELSFDQLGMLLKSFPNLGLVTLSGMATRPMVEALLKAGVPAILASTRSNSSETRSTEIAAGFYHYLANGKTLREAFAAIAGSSEPEEVPLDSGEVRFLSLGFQRAEGELPWGLFFRGSRRKVLDVTLEKPAAAEPSSEPHSPFSIFTSIKKGKLSAWQILAIMVGVLMLLIAFF